MFLSTSYSTILKNLGAESVPILLDIVAYIETFHVKSAAYDKVLAKIVIDGVKDPEYVVFVRFSDTAQWNVFSGFSIG